MQSVSLTAGYILSSVHKLLSSNWASQALHSLCHFEVQWSGENVYNLPNPKIKQLLALVDNYVSRGYPTLASLYVERTLSNLLGKKFSIQDDSTDAELFWSIASEHNELFQRCIAIVDPRLSIERPEADFSHSSQACSLYHKFPAYLQQLVQPERFFSDGLVAEGESDFYRQRVDFAVEIPGGDKWVVEVDGKQHENLDQKTLDQLRDDALFESGWRVARIKTSEIRSWKKRLADLLHSLDQTEYVKRVKSNIQSPLWEEINGKEAMLLSLLPFAVARIHKTLVYLLQQDVISLEQECWNIAVIERDVPAAYLAVDDFFQLLQQFLALMNRSFTLPKVNLAIYSYPHLQSHVKCPQISENITVVQRGAIDDRRQGKFDLVLDLSVLRRDGLGEIVNRNALIAKKGVHVLIRSGYRLNSKSLISTSDPITYNISSPSQEDALLFFLQNGFRKRQFRDGQLKIIRRALSRRNTIGLLPTGGGKSLCYQLVTFLQPGLTLIIDPLRSLMIDQHENLRKFAIHRSAYISSDLTPKERHQVEKRFARGEVQFLFIAPERLQIEEFRHELSVFTASHPIAYAVIDEAHCVSEWGHDFRTSYLLLSRTLKRYCRHNSQVPPIYALTGTASAVVLQDVKLDLGIGDSQEDRNAIITPATFDRPELGFHLYQCPSAEKFEKLEQIIDDICSRFGVSQQDLFQRNENNTYSGLIFAPHVSTTNFSIEHLEKRFGETFGFHLISCDKPCPKCGAKLELKFNPRYSSFFWGCSRYPDCQFTQSIKKDDEPEHYEGIHIFAGKTPKRFGSEAWEKYKIHAQNEYINNQAALMITNKAFGMGIDKPNIRYTIHYNIPQSIEAYYQEAGRAGRDRREAFCAIVFSDDEPKDADKRLDPKLSIEQVCELSKVSRNREGDIHRNLFFQTKSFKGKDVELKALYQILQGSLGRRLGGLQSGQRDSVTVEAVSLKNEKGKFYPDEEATEKALYRLIVIGLIEDYTINFRAKPRTYNIILKKKEPQEYIDHLYDYLALHRADFFSNYPTREAFREYILQRSEKHPVIQCLGELLEFVYSVIEPQRRQALATLVEAVRTGDNAKFRARILRYLEPDEKFNQLFWIFPQSTNLAEWIQILEKADSESSANKILGICLRNLESYPNSVGLRFLAASLRLCLPDEREDYALDDFRVGHKFLKENYPAEKHEQILSYFVFYILEHSFYDKAKLTVAKIFINEYYKVETALRFLQTNCSHEIKALGATYFFQQLLEPVNLLIAHLKR